MFSTQICSALVVLILPEMTKRYRPARSTNSGVSPGVTPFCEAVVPPGPASVNTGVTGTSMSS